MSHHNCKGMKEADLRFEHLVDVIEKYNIHIDVDCYHYRTTAYSPASHTLTSECNPKQINFAYIKDNPAQELADMIDVVIDTHNPFHQTKGGA